MNLLEDIMYLAQANTRKCFIKDINTIDKSIPYFKVFKNDLGRYDIQSSGYQEHDNEPRMQLYEQYFKTCIFPNINKNINISGYYNIELHDSFTYLDNDKDYTNVMCFSKFKNKDTGVLIPDPYMVCNWGGLLDTINDTKEWDKKQNKIVFAGTTTGNKNPLKNERIDFCLWSLNNKDMFDCYITKIAQMDSEYVKKTVNNFDKIYHTPISVNDQINYKYHLSMDGNVCQFDTWWFKTNSVTFKYKSDLMLFYYPLLQAGTHFEEVDKNNIVNKFNYYNNNPNNALLMIHNARTAASNIYRPFIHQIYMTHLFENIAMNT